ncbi:hypothetical protein DFJ74DRAFT_696450 [Hyaloraphidium curvatum]|nr:hypothetical protein DFJ74DRAFT_696450 [Hyaloraphidium curvatum]
MKILDANTGDLDLMVEFGEGRDGRLEICLGCGSFPREKMSKCARCKATPYCGPACQKMDWPRHKLTCVPAAAASEESSSDSVTSVGKSASDGAP